MVATVTYEIETIKANFQANTFESNDQILPDVQGLSNGGFVVAYNNAVSAVVLNFYNAAGDAVGFYDVPYSDSTLAAGAPTVTQMANGNVVVIWDDNAPGDEGLKGAIYTQDGVKVASQFDVSAKLGDTIPQVTALTGENAGFVVTNKFGSGGSIYVEVFDENGVSQSPEILIDGVGADGSEPVVAGLADGGFVVTWTDSSTPGTQLVARIFEADGTPREVDGSTTPFVVATTGDNSQPSITALPNGNWAVAYTDSGWPDEDVGITLTIYGPDGEVVNAFEHVNPPGDPQDESDPDITVLDNGFIVVSWTYPASPGSDDDIHCRIFDQHGNPIALEGSSLIVLDNTFANEVKSAISGILAGQFVAAWQDTDGDGDGDQISATVKELVRTTTGDGTSETLTGDDIRDIINGNGGADTLTGFGGNDRLDGGTGADGMTGGLGNDTYVVDNAGDATVEAAGGGTDTVSSTVTKTLAGNVENLVLNGAAAINGTGNDAINTMSGNSAANQLSGLGQNDTLTGYGGGDRLDGGTGADAMAGGNGDDTYVVENAGDTASEASGSGVDTVQSTVSFTLGSGIEKLVLNGASAINGTGNGGANTMFGNSAINRLDGNGGADTMTGFGGADVFVFDDGDGADTVTDFQNGSDTFDLTAVAGVDAFSDLTVIDNGATVTVNYGTGSFTLGNVANAAVVDASDFVFA